MAKQKTVAQLSPNENSIDNAASAPLRRVRNLLVGVFLKVVSPHKEDVFRCFHPELAAARIEKFIKVSGGNALRQSLCNGDIINEAMAEFKQIHKYFVMIVLAGILHEATSVTEEPKKDTEETLAEAESNGKLEIIKRIKKINDDGSYTIGYEADDGSFKIESRDVLGHIKGTYGFVDDEGQIKRVSYSATNTSEVITKPESPTVVQRIPNKKIPTSYIFTSTQSTPSTTTSSVIQSIAKRRTSTSSDSSTTDKPNYQNVVNVSRISQPSPVVYSSAAPKVLHQGRSTLPSSPATLQQTLKAEAQQVVSVRPSEEPLYRRLVSREEVKPVNEETRDNLLRRQIPQRGEHEYNLREHVFSLQQSLGHDATDVYSSSMTTGTPRPLFTTTNRPIPIQVSTTPVPSTIQRPSPPHPVNYHNYLREEQNQAEYNQESTTTQSEPIHASPSTVPVAQIPPNRAQQQEPLIALRQPNQQTILIPLSHLQGRIIPYENLNDPRGYQYVSEDAKQMVVEIEQQQALVRKLPQHPLIPMPVQVDEHGFIRELPRHVPTPYPVPIPAAPVHRYLENDIDNDIESIQPPVSTKDFQRLLHMLIQRQSRLEKISALTRQAEVVMQPRPVYQQEPYFVQKVRPDLQHQRQNYVEVQQQHLVPLRSQQQFYEEQYDAQSYRPNRRVARLLPPRTQEVQEEYLPSDVREMLLLRMLQLAINPAMPVPEDDIELVTRSSTAKRTPVRNVEILGEEGTDEVGNRSGRTKRYISG